MNKLQLLFEEKIKDLTKQILDYPFEDKQSYCSWLNQQYYLVENSTRYLALSASKVGTQERKEFREWVHHLSEELDHDMLVLSDLKSLNYETKEEPGPFTRAIVATQYYEIEKYGPNALLGYALMLEGLSCQVCDILAQKVEKSFGPGKASYLKLHANVDLEHYPEGLKKISSLDATQSAIVEKNLETMSALYSSMLRWLLAGQKQTVSNQNFTDLNM